MTAGETLRDGPLQGIRVLEFGQLLAGPYVGTLLGDFGAEVVKIEPPPKGDAMRDWGRLRHNDHSLWWSILARNKRSVTLNLREAGAQRIALRLAERVDVVIENFRPGTMERWGLGPDDVHARNPAVVYARVTGYGQTGRYRDRPGFASASEARSGLRYINGDPDRRHRATASRSATRSRLSLRSAGSSWRSMRVTRAERKVRSSTLRSPTHASPSPSRRCSSTRRPASCASRRARDCRGSRRRTCTAPKTTAGW